MDNIVTIEPSKLQQGMLGVNTITQGPSLFEQTHGQVAIWGITLRQQNLGAVGMQLSPLLRDFNTGSPWHYRKVREMRKHPTIKLTRMLSISSMAGAAWGVTTTDKAPEGAKEFITDYIIPLQHQFMSYALRGNFDFGWQPFEKVFGYDYGCGKIILRKLKPLLQDTTQIVVQTRTGSFQGFKQFETYLNLSNSLLINQDVEGTYWYGESTMSAIQMAYDRWLVTDASNTRFDHKISGAHWIVYYPEGFTKVNGVKTDNLDVANRLLHTLEGSGSFCIPSNVRQMTTDLNNSVGEEQWKVELMESNPGQQSGFSARLQYLDALIVRGGEFPERSILEGQYGTKAEAGEHADFAIARMDWRNKNIEDLFNQHVVDQLMVLNYGQEFKGTVKLEISPIADDKKDTIKQIYLAALTNPVTSGGLISNIDLQAIQDQLEIPTLQRDGNDNGQLNNMLANLQVGDISTQVAQPPDGSYEPPEDSTTGDDKKIGAIS